MAQPLFLGNPLRLGADSCAPALLLGELPFPVLTLPALPGAGLQPGDTGRDLLKGLPGGSSWMRGRGLLENNDFCGCGTPGASC